MSSSVLRANSATWLEPGNHREEEDDRGRVSENGTQSAGSVGGGAYGPSGLPSGRQDFRYTQSAGTGLGDGQAHSRTTGVLCPSRTYGLRTLQRRVGARRCDEGSSSRCKERFASPGACFRLAKQSAEAARGTVRCRVAVIAESDERNNKTRNENQERKPQTRTQRMIVMKF